MPNPPTPANRFALACGIVSAFLGFVAAVDSGESDPRVVLGCAAVLGALGWAAGAIVHWATAKAIALLVAVVLLALSPASRLLFAAVAVVVE